jgi:hypothetical protein
MEIVLRPFVPSLLETLVPVGRGCLGHAEADC